MTTHALHPNTNQHAMPAQQASDATHLNSSSIQLTSSMLMVGSQLHNPVFV